jgi:type II secretory pathway pseudopilin PulG
MSRLRNQDGLALIPAITTVAIVLFLGTALLAAVNVQTRQTATERAKEASFRLAESALNSSVLQVSTVWPGSSALAYGSCTQSTTPSATCPGSALAANFTAMSGGSPNGGTDFGTAPTWSLRVIDDEGGPDYYDEALATKAPTPCACDLKGSSTGTADGAVWVRAEATVQGQKSVLVSLVARGSPRLESVPRNSITAGFVQTSNSGKKVILDVKGTSAAPANVAVRCASSGPSSSDSCLGFDPSKGQLSPAGAYQASYPGSASLDSAALARLKERAQTAVPSTYYATGTCPPSLDGAFIYIENANCSYNGGAINSPAAPGVVIFGNGTLTLGGNAEYYGLIYNANSLGSAPPCTSANQNTVVSLSGTSSIQGAVLVDKCGGVAAGSSGAPNFVFDANVFANLVSNGTPSGVKGSFRIIPTS